MFCPLEFFENLTFKWVPLIGFWINIFLNIFFYFTRKGTTNNLPFLNTQNRPTLFYNGQWLTVSFELLNKRDPRDSQ